MVDNKGGGQPGEGVRDGVSAKVPAKASAKVPAKVRADLALVAQGLAPSRERARSLILAGEVLDGDRPVNKAGELVAGDAPLRLRNPPMPYVSRGGVKLAHALGSFALDVKDLVAIDIGASTGGFTDCLLQAGAARVYAVDVGQAQLHWKLVSDPRVVVLDRINVRHLQPTQLPELADVAVIDVSFISLRLVLPVVPALLRPGSPVVALVKPQFEVGPARVGKGGIVRDEAARADALTSITEVARTLGFSVGGQTTSPITGSKGNVEFLLCLRTA
jgi:23S rRNA (cytidine1920-2'-O)/16S rRNA (cytidine1409-2'-O)-methyltransferase